ncbi:RagB/SusD family nutrient uptake outer membrane protein [Parabacteroides chinchillae]
MKKIAIWALAAVTLMTSCDLDRFPYDKYSKDKIDADKVAAFDILLNGCYAKLKSASDVFHRTGEYPGDNICKDKPTTNPFGTYITYQHTVNNSQLSSTWNHAYNIISQTSDLMKMANEGESPEIDQKLGEAYYMRGLMYFYLCRVFGRPYYQEPEKNMGVPIVNGMPDDIANLQLPDRSSVKDTYAQAINDLKKAESLMTTYTSASYASKYAAQAMLAKVYMYMSGTFENPNTDYAKESLKYADDVINSGKFSLLNRTSFMRYNELAPDDASQTETIFAVKFISSDVTDYTSAIGSMYATINEVGWGEIYASAKYLDILYETGRGNDAREAFIHPDYKLDDKGNKTRNFRFVANIIANGKVSGYTYKQCDVKVGSDGKLVAAVLDSKEYPLTLLDEASRKYSIVYEGTTYHGYDDYFMNTSQGHPKFFNYKCSMQEGVSHLYSPIISRLGEVYLIRAEANAKLGNYADALKDLNMVRERSIVNGGYQTLNASNAHQLIMKERQLELAFEADRGFDVYRVGDTMTRHYPGYHDGTIEFLATSPLVVQYIPKSEIDAYPGTLTQNP